MNNKRKNFLEKRYKSEKRFQLFGLVSISLALIFLAIFLIKIFSNGYSAFTKTWIFVEVNYDRELLLLEENPSSEDLNNADYYDIAYQSIITLDPEVDESSETFLIEMFAYNYELEIKNYLKKNPSDLGKIVKIKVNGIRRHRSNK